MKLWPSLLIAALMIHAGTSIYVVTIAANDPGFAVEENYYEKASNWDRHVAVIQQSRAMGWQVDLKVAADGASMTLSAVDKKGLPLEHLTWRYAAFHNARAAEVFEGGFENRGDGGYMAPSPFMRSGLWEVRVRTKHEGKVFQHTFRLER